ncbi:MAG: HvfC/BufC family peptide modification chaperone [Candidatus Xenobia bacterium]
MADLAELQRFLQAFIVDPGDDATVEAAMRERAEQYIRPSATLLPLERLNIYRGLYLNRFVRVLQANHPALRRFMGKRAFTRVVAQYVTEHPSIFWNVNRLALGFPEFLTTVRGLRRKDFCVDLARLELAAIQAMLAPDAPVLHHHEVMRQRDRLENVIVVPGPSLRLLELRYPVHEYVMGRAGVPSRQAGWIVVYRRHQDIMRQPLNAVEYGLLADIVGGKPLGEALSRSSHADPAMLFFNWVSAGLFSTMR